MLSRRRFIQSGLLLAALPKQWVLAGGQIFRNTFKVPALYVGERKGKVVMFDLNIQAGKSELFAGLKTPTLGINQNFLGVTLRANKGDKVRIRVKNNIDKTSTLHWHGMKLPAKADGGPHQPISPGKTWRTEFDIIQPAASLWYHSHQLHETAEQVYQGLAGMFIIDDEQANALNLPSEYGVDDLPIIIQDKDFNANGSLRYLSGMMDRMMGKKGGTALVNGVVNPILKAQKSLLRLRLLNGSNAKTYFLHFDDNRTFHIIGSDGGLLEKPQQTNLIRLAPAERAEILLNVASGIMPILQHKAGQEQSSMGGMGMMRSMMGATDKNLNIMQIDASNAQKTTVALPKQLVKHKSIDASKASRTRAMKLQMKMGPMMMFGDAFSINGKSMNIKRIDEVVSAGSTEIWEISNDSVMAHPFHIHNVQFKIISKSSGSIDGHELGFKDVVLVNPRQRIRVVMQFPQFRDDKTPYMYHCHILEHEDQGMMGQFVVV
ncbi:MAG: multicopper oxidase domain-containing protein [Candidatus Thioglobus sp.]|nr:multicopper oxidase domain-containing protein [Candidatus Thioglobus sp.]